MDEEESFDEQRTLYLQDLIKRYSAVKDEASNEETQVDKLVFGGLSWRTPDNISNSSSVRVNSSSNISHNNHVIQNVDHSNVILSSLPSVFEDDSELEYILLEGPAACGKTWLLIKVLLYYAQKALSSPSGLIPLFVPAVKLARHGSPTLESYLAGVYSQGAMSRGHAAGRHGFLLKALEMKRVILLVDGLDETVRYRPEVAEYVLKVAVPSQPRGVVALRPEARFWLPVDLLTPLNGVFMGQLSAEMQRQVVSARCSPPCFCSSLLLLLQHPAVSELSRCVLALALARQLISDRGMQGLSDEHIAAQVEEIERGSGGANDLVGGGMLRRMLVETTLRELLHAHDARKYLIGSSEFDRDREGDIKLLASTDAQTMLESLAEAAFQRDKAAHLKSTAEEIEGLRSIGSVQSQRFFTDKEVSVLVEEHPSYGSIWSVMYKISPLFTWPTGGEGKGYGALTDPSPPASHNNNNKRRGSRSLASADPLDAGDAASCYFFSYTPIMNLLVAKAILKKLGKKVHEAKNDLEKIKVLSSVFDELLLYNSRYHDVLRQCGIMARSDIFELIVTHLVAKDDATLAASQVALELIRDRPMDDRQRPLILKCVSEVAEKKQRQPFIRWMLHPSPAMRTMAVEQFLESGLDTSAVGLDLLQVLAKSASQQEWYIKLAAGHCLGILRANEQVVVDALAWLAGNEDEWEAARLEAVSSLALLSPSTGNIVSQLCTGSRVWDTEVAQRTIKCLRQPHFINAMLDHLDEEDVCRVLSTLGVPDSRLMHMLIQKLEHPSPQWRSLAATCLQQLGGVRGGAVGMDTISSALRGRIRDTNEVVRLAVARSLVDFVPTMDASVQAKQLAEQVGLALQYERENDVRAALSDLLSALAKYFGSSCFPETLWSMLCSTETKSEEDSEEKNNNNNNNSNSDGRAVELQLLVLDALKHSNKTDTAAIEAMRQRLNDESIFVRVKAAGALLVVASSKDHDSQTGDNNNNNNNQCSWVNEACDVLVEIIAGAKDEVEQDDAEEQGSYSARVMAVHTVCSMTNDDKSSGLNAKLLKTLLWLFQSCSIDREALACANEGDIKAAAHRLTNLRVEALHSLSVVRSAQPEVFTLLLNLDKATNIFLPQALRVEAIRTLAEIGTVQNAMHGDRGIQILHSLFHNVKSTDAALRAAVAGAIARLYPLTKGVDATSVGLTLLELVTDADESVSEEALKCVRQLDIEEVRVAQYIAASLAEHCVLDISMSHLKGKRLEDEEKKAKPNSWRRRMVKMLAGIADTVKDKRSVELLFAILDMMDVGTEADIRANAALKLETVKTLATLGLKADKVEGNTVRKSDVIQHFLVQMESNPSSALLLELCAAVVRLGHKSETVSNYLLGILASNVSISLKQQCVLVLMTMGSSDIAFAKGIWAAMKASADYTFRGILYTAMQNIPITNERLCDWIELLGSTEFAMYAFEHVVSYCNAQQARSPHWILPAKAHRLLHQQVSKSYPTAESVQLMRMVRLKGMLTVLPPDNSKGWFSVLKLW